MYWSLFSQRPLVFLHLPKTAGNSLIEIISNNIQYGEQCPVRSWEEFVNKSKLLRGYKFHTGHLYYDFKYLMKFNPNFVTFLREPVSRIVSEYRFICRTPHHLRHEKVRAMSFEQFIETPGYLDIYQRFLTCRPSGTLRKPDFYRMLPVSSAEAVKVAIKRMENFFFIGLTERFSESISVFTKIMGWEFPAEIPQSNKSPSVTANQLLTDHVLATIRQRAPVEFQIYDHAVEIVNRKFLPQGK